MMIRRVVSVDTFRTAAELFERLRFETQPRKMLCRWHCARSMRSRVYVAVRCPSVRLSHSPAATAFCGFAAAGPAGRRYRSIAAHHIITSHHIEETDAGLDRPLYLRNRLYDKTLKSRNYYSNILRFPVTWRSALWLCNTSWLDQNLSKRFLKRLTVSAETTWFERLFHIGITRLVKLNFLKS